jgi:mono/diheme cytochrome c family protein
MSTTTSFPTLRRVAAGVAVLSLALVTTARSASPAAQAKAAPEGASSSVARGEYLATRVAMCVQCHSGRDEKGALSEAKKFRGGTIPFKSPWSGSEWAYQAPSIAGLPGFTDEQIVALLTEGAATGRSAPRSPMPPFRMSREDAPAIAAYLRSL